MMPDWHQKLFMQTLLYAQKDVITPKHVMIFKYDARLVTILV